MKSTLHRKHMVSPAGTPFELLWEDVTIEATHQQTFPNGFIVGGTWFRFFYVEPENADKVEYAHLIELYTPDGAIRSIFDVGKLEFDPVWVDRILTAIVTSPPAGDKIRLRLDEHQRLRILPRAG